jgi:hypothetical protein
VAVGFPINYGFTFSGGDFAYFFDSEGVDTFVGATEYCYMSGLGFFNESVGYGWNSAQSFVGGDDYAYIYDPSRCVLSGFTCVYYP